MITVSSVFYWNLLHMFRVFSIWLNFPDEDN